ncbi:hypothetical protein [Flaviaesturariibacter terrae]
MYTTLWNKYLPAIRIVMKRARSGPQSLQLNAGDFERVGLKRKSGYPFSIGLEKGRLQNVIIDQPLANDLAQLLLEDQQSRALFEHDTFELTLNSKWELSIRHTPELVSTSDDDETIK